MVDCEAAVYEIILGQHSPDFSLKIPTSKFSKNPKTWNGNLTTSKGAKIIEKWGCQNLAIECGFELKVEISHWTKSHFEKTSLSKSNLIQITNQRNLRIESSSWKIKFDYISEKWWIAASKKPTF